MNLDNHAGGIFQSVGHAVHVAFLILSQDAQQGSVLRKTLLQMLEAIPSPTKRQFDWLGQLRGTHSDTVDFSGLASLDIRAQCAMIKHAVNTRLPRLESSVLHAKYGSTEYEDINGCRRFAFSAERIEALKFLSDWLLPSFPNIPSLAMDCMVAKVFANHRKVEISFRSLAKSFGESHMTYARVFPKMKQQLRDLETQAINRLTPYFMEQGVIENILESA